MREQISKYPYGEYYGLKPNQPKEILRLLNELDNADEVIKHQFFKIERLNNIINKIEEHFVFLKMNSTGGNKEFFEDILDFIKALKELKGSDKE